MSACNACNIWTHVLFDIYGQKHALRTARLLAVLPLIGVHIYTYRPMPLTPNAPKQRLLPRLPRLSRLGRHLLLIVLAKALVLAGLWWAVYHGQFESVEQEGERILRDG